MEQELEKQQSAVNDTIPLSNGEWYIKYYNDNREYWDFLFLTYRKLRISPARMSDSERELVSKVLGTIYPLRAVGQDADKEGRLEYLDCLGKLKEKLLQTYVIDLLLDVAESKEKLRALCVQYGIDCSYQLLSAEPEKDI